ncbi:polysaccharide deacetylase family protein [Actinomadura sp. J1-007]|nr:polysaccharide deacetylase family protein [Actinomadura sp. J1-007]
MARRWAAGILVAAACAWLSAFGSSVSRERAGAAAAEIVTPVAAKPVAPPPKPVPPPVDCRARKCVALTFDDGPMDSTAKLLDLLASRKVKATFFLVGRNAAARPDLVRREQNEGHAVANHSYTHADLGRSSSGRIASELSKTQDAIRRATGVTPTLMRPPYGSTSAKVASVTKRMGLAQVLWTVDPLDWQIRDAKAVERRIVRATRPGHIVLMHDIHPTTVAAVPAILKRLSAKGYEFVTVPELYGKPLKPGRKYVER